MAAFGSPGGSSILDYNTKTAVGVLAWKLSMQQAIELPNLIARGNDIAGEVDRFSPEVLGRLARARHQPGARPRGKFRPAWPVEA